MPVEVEVKLRLPDAGRARRRLAQAGVRLGRAVRQEDTFFTGPGGRKADEALRQRRHGASWELTYKGPRDAKAGTSGVKARKEVTVGLRGDATELLACLGYAPTLRVAKTRRSGVLRGVTLALDEVEGLGWFLELEVVCEARAVAKAQARIEETLAALGIEGERVQASYAELLAA